MPDPSTDPRTDPRTDPQPDPQSGHGGPSRANLYLALGCLALSLVIAFVWVPLDSGSGLMVKMRRQVGLGDALAPTVAAGFVGVGALLLLLQRRDAEQQALTRGNLMFLLRFLVICLVAFTLMRWSGPAAVALAALSGAEMQDYRLLRDTAPWKYIGYFLGGSFLIAALITNVEGRLRPVTVLIAIVAITALILLYDLPFDDLQLPPNGDV